MVHRGMVRVGRARAAVLVALLVAFGLTSVGVAGASASEADTIATLVNQARANAGLPRLIHNPAMDVVALSWAERMAAANLMGHNPSYTSEIPAGWSRAGENVAMGLPTPSAMHTAWMNSPDHRANILGDFTDIGIAFITVNGTTWGAENFGTYAGHAPAPAPAAQLPAAQVPAAQVPSVSPPAAAPMTGAPAPAAPAPAAPAPAPGATSPTAPISPTAEPTASPIGSPTAAPSAVPATPGSGATRSPVAESVMLEGSITANPKPFPFGYVLGGILVVLGIAGGIYGQRLRIRGRRPPRP